MNREWVVPDEDLGVDGAYFNYQELVRCKDCKWNNDTSVNHGNMFPKCKFTDYVRTGDFYCAMGERRQDD